MKTVLGGLFQETRYPTASGEFGVKNSIVPKPGSEVVCLDELEDVSADDADEMPLWISSHEIKIPKKGKAKVVSKSFNDMLSNEAKKCMNSHFSTLWIVDTQYVWFNRIGFCE